MKERSFTVALLVLISLGLIVTVGHLIYDFYAYQHCSIIYFIGKELW